MALTRFLGQHGSSPSNSGASAAWLVLLVVVLATWPGGDAARRRAPPSCPTHDVVGRVRYLPHPRDCSMFLRCHRGREVPGRCPSGTAFVRSGDSGGFCGDPARSRCAPCAPSGNCGYQCTCGGHRGNKVTCPVSTAFPAMLTITEAGCHRDEGTFTLLRNKIGRVQLAPGASSLNIKKCPDDLPPGKGYVPHFADCSKVFYCENGQEVVSKCPDGYVYDLEIGICDRPQYVNCSLSSVDNEALPPADGCPPEATLLPCRYACECPVSSGQDICPQRLEMNFHIRIFDSSKNPDCLKVAGVVKFDDPYVAIGSLEPNSTRAYYCPTATSKPTYVAHPLDCESFIVCLSGGAESVRRCPAGRQFNPTTQRCGEPDASLCLSASRPPPASLHQQASLRCPTSWVCSAAYRGVPHISDCTLFCRCDGAQPVLAACPPGTHFSARSQTCEEPAVAQCKSTCAQLGELKGSGGKRRGIWQPKSCIEGDSELNARCSLKCSRNYHLDGSRRIRCTRQGWASNAALNIIPSCRTPEEIGSNLVSKINESLSQLRNAQTEMLFIIDEASNITAKQFEIQKRLVATIVNIFPLSENRVAGLATLGGQERVYIRQIGTSTCDFLAELRSEDRRSASGRSGAKRVLDITQALEAVATDGLVSRALIFLITSKRSRAKPLPAVDQLKKSRYFVFTIGIGKYNPKHLNLSSSHHRDGSRLFFGLSNVRSAKDMIAHMSREYGSEDSNYCF